MDKDLDLDVFESGQIIVARRMSHSIPENVSELEISRSTASRLYRE